MLKRKEYNAIINKIVKTNKVLSRGQRVPVIELNFKPNGFSKDNGHTVYVDYKCAKELLAKIDTEIREIEASYFPFEMINRINKLYDGRDVELQAFPGT